MSDAIYASEIECRCDCVNCVTGHHESCYYEPECHLKLQAFVLKVDPYEGQPGDFVWDGNE